MDNRSGATPAEYRTILVAFDGSEGSTRALRRAMEIAARYGGRAVVYSVYEQVPRHAPGVGEIDVEESVRDQYTAQMRQLALAAIGEEGAQVTIEMDSGHAAQAIISRASGGKVDLVVIGRSGHSGLWGVLLGSTTKRVVDQATCDVLVVG